MFSVSDLKVKIFADGADLPWIHAVSGNTLIRGFTTNPTLMRKAGVVNYKNFARNVLKIIGDRPVSFGVLSDEFEEMERQALEISTWGSNVTVKIPVTNTKGQFSGPLFRRLADNGVRLNITAVMTMDQIRAIVDHLGPETSAIISVFAGRIADTGEDPLPVMHQALEILKARPKAELLWASPREVLNIIQANEVGCHIVTATHDILKKLPLLGKNHAEYSLETVQMFYNDSSAAGYTIPDSCQTLTA